VVPRSRFADVVTERARAVAESSPARTDKGIELTPLRKKIEADRIEYVNVVVEIDRDARLATVTLRGPSDEPAREPGEIRELGASWWPLEAFRELDDALLHLRVNEEVLGLILLKTEGSLDAVLAVDEVLAQLENDWLVRETRMLIARVLRRLDLTAKSLFALIEPGSCFAGTLFELALAADRSYMLDDPAHPVSIATSTLNADAYPMTHGVSRLAARFLGEPERAARIVAEPRSYAPNAALDAGLVTVVADDIDYEDEVRVAIEERGSLSPDALTGMEANLRFPGAENCDSKIFGRLSAWQNWIFQRPNAVGDRGALTLYGKPERPAFDWRRT
jgi:benzoyl-CoA-dihydrodiol lyase